ncbi:MAG: type II toxin-antitoxin system prevent-host-death family antitoxin [bacterium]|nr:type II toxin-antitoxin system prevent-host-death family antitoxin [bacterium]
MTTVGVKILKDQLSRYLQLASDGERIVMTDRGRPIAQLTGIETNDETRQASDLVEAGLASWDGGKPKGSANPPKVRGKTAAEMMIEDRR